jgi:hypothetical protein
MRIGFRGWERGKGRGEWGMGGERGTTVAEIVEKGFKGNSVGREERVKGEGDEEREDNAVGVDGEGGR